MLESRLIWQNDVRYRKRWESWAVSKMRHINNIPGSVTGQMQEGEQFGRLKSEGFPRWHQEGWTAGGTALPGGAERHGNSVHT